MNVSLLISLGLLFVIGCGGAERQGNTSNESKDPQTVEQTSPQSSTQSNTSTNDAENNQGSQSAGTPSKGSTEWGGSMDAVRKKVAAIPGVQLIGDTTVGIDGRLTYVGGRYLDLPVRMWTFGFNGEQMMFAQLQFPADQSTGLTVDSLYAAFQTKMTERYGPVLIDSERRISRPLSTYSTSDQQFIAQVLQGFSGHYRGWVGENNGKINTMVTVNKAKVDGMNEMLLVAWYDKEQTEAYIKAREQ